jgi:hypothetical protein
MNIKYFQNIKDFLRSREEGVAMPMVILISALLLGFGLALTTNTVLETGVTSNNERSIVAYYAAEIGLERAINNFRTSYSITSVPADGATLYNQEAVSYSGNTSNSDYTVTVSRRDAPVGSPIAPFPVFFTIRSVGRQLPLNTTASTSTATLEQTVSVTPTSLAVYTLFYDRFAGTLGFQNTFRLTGSLAINETTNTVRMSTSTRINGDLYVAGSLQRSAPTWGVPIVSGNFTENGGVIPFPTTVTDFTSGAVAPYRFTGTTRFKFFADGTFRAYNSAIAGGSTIMSMPSNGLISVTGGDAVVEGTVKGRVTVTGDDDILINGNIRYADQSSGSWDTLALVADGDVILPTNYYLGGDTGYALSNFEANWGTSGHTVASGITGGTWGSAINADVYVDATLVSLNGSTPAVIAPSSRPLHQFYLYGNDISKIASATVNSNNPTTGLNENYNENRKLAILPPPGFPTFTTLTPTFLTFREIRTAIGG